MTAYSDATKIAAYLGSTLTTDQQTQAAAMAQAASDFVDQYIGGGRSWQSAAAVSNELHTVSGGRIFLKRRPAVAVTSVQVRQPAIMAQWTTLDAGQYELLDPTNGVVLVVGWGDYIARVSYTHGASTPPSQVALATTMIAAAWMTNTLQPDSFGMDSIAVGQGDIVAKFSSNATDVPPEALSILKGLRVPIIA
jgi:hypothetical protein